MDAVTDPDTGISIHAPREGGDPVYNHTQRSRNISIHAPREGGDFVPLTRGTDYTTDFNPRPPRGGRPRAFIPGAVE